MSASFLERCFLPIFGVLGALSISACGGATTSADVRVFSVWIAGRVTDAQNLPVAGAKVEMSSFYNNCLGGGGNGRGEAVADANGNYLAEVIGASDTTGQCILVRSNATAGEAQMEVRSPQYRSRGVAPPDTIRVDLRLVRH